MIANKAIKFIYKAWRQLLIVGKKHQLNYFQGNELSCSRL